MKLEKLGFKEAMAVLDLSIKNGRESKARRKDWIKEAYIYCVNSCHAFKSEFYLLMSHSINEDEEEFDCEATLYLNDIMAEDWEVII